MLNSNKAWGKWQSYKLLVVNITFKTTIRQSLDLKRHTFLKLTFFISRNLSYQSIEKLHINMFKGGCSLVTLFVTADLKQTNPNKQDQILFSQNLHSSLVKDRCIEQFLKIQIVILFCIGWKLTISAYISESL